MAFEKDDIAAIVGEDALVRPKPTDPMAERKSGRRRKAAAKPAIRHTDPKVAAHVAKVAIKHAMDMEGAVKEIVPDATPAEAKKLVMTLEGSPTVKKAVAEELVNAGLDENAKKVYVNQIWDWFQAPNKAAESPILTPEGTRDYKAELRRLEVMKEFALTAARILSKAFIAEKIEDNRLQPLKIVGFEEGVKRLMGKNEDPDEFTTEDLPKEFDA
jgi:hypothetical protein